MTEQELTTPVEVVETPTTPKEAPKAKKKKDNFFVRAWKGICKFWKEYTSELKKVTWMSWKDIKKNTILVVCVVIVFSAAIALVDTAFGEIIEGIASLIG